jgi:two-component system phosphate regulon sensor histidine kinase PhoR
VDPTVLALIVVALTTTVASIVAVVLANRARRERDEARTAAGEARDRAELAGLANARADATVGEIVSLVGVGVLRLSDDLAVTMANEPAVAILGRDRRRLVGHQAFEAFADQRLVDLVSAARSGGRSQAEIGRDGPDGTRFLARAMRSPAGGVWLTVEDVSELRRLQRIRAEFIDNLSHELRTPLTSLGLLAETLSRDVEASAASGGPVTTRMQERVGKIELETAHLTQMVTEMLDLSRIEAGGATSAVQIDEVDMAALLVATADRSRTFAERSAVRLVVDVSKEGSLAVRGDEDRLGQVLLNLIHNAVKFSPPGAEVIVAVMSDGPDVVTTVVDHGIGIPAEAQARIFERFFKVDRARARGEGGTGLGLAIARHIVDSHGGRIWVESREGVGSTFSFALPAIVPARREVAVVAG